MRTCLSHVNFIIKCKLIFTYYNCFTKKNLTSCIRFHSCKETSQGSAINIHKKIAPTLKNWCAKGQTFTMQIVYAVLSLVTKER